MDAGVPIKNPVAGISVGLIMGDAGKYSLLTEIMGLEDHFGDMFTKMMLSMNSWASETKSLIENLVAKYGKIRAKAFPGRAAIIIKMLGLDETKISNVYEIKGSIKVGHYVPGTRIAILPEATLYSEPDQTKPILNFRAFVGEIGGFTCPVE